jgi:hypothetical protein
MNLVETAPHEFNANYNFDEGLQPYFAFDRVVKTGGGTEEGTFELAGDRWEVTLYYQDSNIVDPGKTTPAGTPFKIEEIREFRLSVEAIEDDHQAGERGFNAHIRPRWDGMSTEDEYGQKRTVNIPFKEGLNVKIQGSNIEFQDYLSLLQQAFQAVSVAPSSIQEPHKSSNVQQAERYVRVHEDVSGPIHARDGPLARLGHLLEGDRDGRRRIEQADVAEDGECVPGYRHQVGIDERRVQEVFPDHALPKRWKHYRARESHNIDGPLQHPKIGAIYYPSLWRDNSENHGVSPEDLDQLTEELEDALLSILHDAGLDVTSTAPYVSDDYFTATTSERARQVVDLPLEEIKTDQESVVISQIADGLSPVEWTALDTLVSDGGEVAPEDIADSGGFHIDSVYRALSRMDELVQREYGSVELRSSHVAELVHDTVREARERTRAAVEAGAKALAAAERGLDERTSAFVAWASKYCDGFTEREEGLTIRFGEIDADSVNGAEREIRRRLREGKRLWDEARRDDIVWRLGEWSARVEVERHPDTNYLNETDLKSIGGKLWETTGQ